MKIVIKKESQKGFAPPIVILGAVALIMVVFLIGKLNQSSPEKVATLSNSVPTVTPQLTPTLAQLLAPSNLTASGVANTNNIYDTLTLNWKDNSNNENGFALQRSTNSNFTNNVLTISVPANTTTFVDTRTVVRGQTYYYRVSSSSNEGNSNWSNATSIIAPFSLTPTSVTNRVTTPTPTPSQIPTPTNIYTSPVAKLEAQLVCVTNAHEGYWYDKHVDFDFKVILYRPSFDFGTLTLTDNKTNEIFDFADGGHAGPVENFQIDSGWGYVMHHHFQDTNYKQMLLIADGREYTLKLYKMTTISQAVTQDLQPVAQVTFSKICEF